MEAPPHNHAPGERVEIRDAEWRIKRVDFSSDGGHVLTCEGLSELVRGKEGLFLTELDTIRVLDPAKTELVDDLTGNFDASLLYIDSMLRKTAPSDGRLHLGHRAALDQLPFQLEPALQALRQPRQRILIADSVGLGKTLEAGILTAELIARGRGKRILVLAVKSMLTQFQKEFWTRFTIPLVRLDSTGLQRVRHRIPTNHNPFHYFDRSIISIDTLKQDIEYRHYLEQAYWDIIIIDEAHNVAERGSNSQRSRLAKLLSTRSDTLIMLSATPHDGKAESFASLVNMLDPTAIANPKDYVREDFRDKGLVIRRFKSDVKDQLKGNFPEREIEVVKTPASTPEEIAYDRLMEVSFHNLNGGGQGAGQLFRTTLEKALFSSPQACLSVVNNRTKRLQQRLERERDDERRTTIIEDMGTLQGLALALKAITPEHFSKYQLLKQTIQQVLQWSPKDTEDRLVIFTESLVTLDFLEKHLAADLKVNERQLAVMRGDMRDKELMETVEAFNRKEASVRLLICSDVASEGINLHHLSHRMIHFDIPWSLMVFQQRNGRIDRYGQTRQPQIRYLLTESDNAKVRGDQRILEVLIQKDEQANKNIGDPSEFLGVYDQTLEEEKVAGFIEQQTDDEDATWRLFESMLDGNVASSENPLDQFIPGTRISEQNDIIGPLNRVFPTGLEYAKAAIRWFKSRGETLDAGIENDVFWVTAPTDLRQRLNYLPSEIRPAHDQFTLSTKVDRISEEIKRARQEEEAAWPSLQFLWPIHPVMEWLSDRALNAFGRHAAPVLRITGTLAADEHIVLTHGGYPNRRGHVLIQDWMGVRIKGSTVVDVVDWQTLQKELGIQPASMPNAGKTGEVEPLSKLLPLAINAAYAHLAALKANLEQERQQSLREQRQRLAELKNKHVGQLTLELGKSDQPEAFKARKRDEGHQHIDRVFKDYEDWLDNTQLTEDQPYLQVAAVFTGMPA